jgi:hypothetical protein
MAEEFRTAPSGREVTVTPTVLSVFGRVGDVVAEPDDYDTDQVDNDSDVTGAEMSDALEELADSSGRINASSVTGVTLTAALNTLLAGITPYKAGTTHETFSGGVETGAAGTSANVGDFAWNIQQVGTSVVGPTCVKVPGTGTSFGVYRLTTPTSASGTPAGFICFLGSGASAGQGPLRWDQLSSATWRARFDPSTATTNLFFLIGFQDAADALIQCGFAVQIGGVGSNSHYQAVATNVGGGGFVFTATTVTVDSNFHTFRIVRTNATTVTYFIDGVQVAQINNAAAVPGASQVMLPVFKGTTGNSGAQTPSFVEVDDFLLTPV